MNKNILGVIFVGVIVIIFGGVLYLQGVQLNIVSSTLSRVVTTIEKNNQTKTVAPTSTSNNIREPALEVVTSVVKTRSSFGPLVSSDGKWIVKELRETFENVTLEKNVKATHVAHTLMIQDIYSGASKNVFRSDEYMTPNFEPITGKSFPTVWTLAGWSKDGQKVYYVTTPVTEGLGGAYPVSTSGGNTLYEVNIQTGVSKQIFSISDINGVVTGILDFSGDQQKMIVADKQFFIADPDGSNKKILSTTLNSISVAVLSPLGDKVAVVSYTPKSGDIGIGDALFTYNLHVIDLATLSSKEIKNFPQDFILPLSWKDNTTLTVPVSKKPSVEIAL